MPALQFVLVHGGAATGAFWDRLVPQLDHAALAVDLPGRGSNGKPFDPMTFGVPEGVASIVDDVEAAGAGGDLVFVGHSSGGLFVPGAAAALAPRVKHVILSAASVPPEGGLGLDAMKPKHRDRVVQGMEAARRDGWVLTTPGPPDDAELMRSAYGGDPLDDETLAFVVDPSRAIKDSMNIYFQPVSWASIKEVPVTYVKNLRDRAVPPDLQDEMMSRLPNKLDVIEMDVGHIPAVTHPEEFAAICNRIASTYA
jgi:pimeloyl-ACP methyl ester carboxylesterase